MLPPRLVKLAGGFELLPQVGLSRFEQAVAAHCAAVGCKHERFVDQRSERFEDMALTRVLATRGSNRAIYGKCVSENREAPGKNALVLAEQLIAPVERRAQRLLARQQVPSASRQQRKPLIESIAELLRAQKRRSCRREFDRERNTVEAAANFGDG